MIRVRQIKIPVLKDSKEELENRLLKKMRLTKNELIQYQIVKKSIDARKKEELYFVYEIDVEIKNEKEYTKKNKNPDILSSPDSTYHFVVTGEKTFQTRPIIVGAGPAGLFCGLLLAENGYHPLIIDRGEKIEDRVKTVNEFWEKGILNPNSNVQFGEGGAGTFSDGKLNTLVADKYHRGRKVFETFVECGAPEEIMYINKPHIGTDVLRKVVQNMRNQIISLGGSFLYNTCLTDVIIENNQIQKVVLNQKEIVDCEVLVLAIGHSSRDTFTMLLERGLKMKSKPFAVGLRISHPQAMINEIQYGKKFAAYLPAASYKLVHHTKEKRGVYTFCMCPGGYVVNASSEEKKLAINGMSNHDRGSKNSNAAIVVTVDQKDFGSGVLAGVEFQQKLEQQAYTLGKGKIPVQLLADFINHKTSTQFGCVEPLFKGGYTFSDLNNLLPENINDAIKEGIFHFDQKMKGYLLDSAILAGVESRTSSPVTILRDEHLQSNIQGIYPCGEGCGYAGGITTAAMDGIKVAEMIAAIYQN